MNVWRFGHRKEALSSFLHHNTSQSLHKILQLYSSNSTHTSPSCDLTSFDINSLSGGWERQKTVKLLQPPPLLTTSLLTLLNYITTELSSSIYLQHAADSQSHIKQMK